MFYCNSQKCKVSLQVASLVLSLNFTVYNKMQNQFLKAVLMHIQLILKNCTLQLIYKPMLNMHYNN